MDVKSGVEQHGGGDLDDEFVCLGPGDGNLAQSGGRKRTGAGKQSADCLGNDNKDSTRRVMLESWGL